MRSLKSILLPQVDQSTTGAQLEDRGAVDRVTKNGRAKVTESNKGHGATEPLHGRLP